MDGFSAGSVSGSEEASSASSSSSSIGVFDLQTTVNKKSASAS
jgi:hypothetical protein